MAEPPIGTTMPGSPRFRPCDGLITTGVKVGTAPTGEVPAAITVAAISTMVLPSSPSCSFLRIHASSRVVNPPAQLAGEERRFPQILAVSPHGLLYQSER